MKSSVLLFTSLICNVICEYYSFYADNKANGSVVIFDERIKGEMLCGVSTYTTPNMPANFAGEMDEAIKSCVINYFLNNNKSNFSHTVWLNPFQRFRGRAIQPTEAF